MINNIRSYFNSSYVNFNKKYFIRAEGFNTQELAARGSLGAFPMVLNPKYDSLA